jgi:uncharacterized membrane protein YdjX (TVP38/TMEM64 family)
MVRDRPHALKIGRFGFLLLLVAGSLIIYLLARPYLDLAYLAEREQSLRDYQSRHPWIVYLMAALFYVIVTGLSLPGAAGLTLVYGWYFGFLPAVILVSFASTAGATIAFLLSRYLFRKPLLERYGERFRGLDQRLKQQGASYLLTLRLIPLLPFFLVNLLMGLTAIPTWTYWWVSQVGMLPGTLAYVYAGASVPSLERLAEEGVRAAFSGRQLLQLLIAFSILGLLPWAMQWFVGYLQAHRSAGRIQ